MISFEEYYPFGSTSFQSGRSSAEVSLKRYRYTGKERDEETGFNYHGARYYAPWLLRWMAVDPLESKYAGIGSYIYCLNSPIMNVDDDGRDIFVFTERTTRTFTSYQSKYGSDYSGNTASKSMSYKVLKAPGADRFFYQKESQSITVQNMYNFNTKSWDKTESRSAISVSSSKEFFPLRQGILSSSASGGIADAPRYSSGITKTSVAPLISHWDGDFISLAKMSDSSLRATLSNKDRIYNQLNNYENSYKIGASALMAYTLADLAASPVGASVLKAWQEAKVANGAKQINFFRTNLNIGKTKNIAYAEGKIGGENVMEVAVSGEHDRAYLTQNPGSRNFTTLTVDYPRAFDSEVKILESLAKKYAENPTIQGRLTLVSERPYCASCSGVIEQFQKMFPNIKIDRVSGVK